MIKTGRLKLYLLPVFILFILFVMTAGEAFALWYSSDWSFRQKITIDSSMVPGDLSNFPVLVDVTNTNLIASPGGNVGKLNGGDILFTSSNGTIKLDHEIESYNNATGELVAWVEVQNISSASDTEFYMYYGNAGAADQWSVNGTWDGNYRGVWHLSEDPSGTAPQMQDSTINNNDMTSGGGMISGDQVAGQINGSLNFDENNDYIIRNPVNNFPTTVITASFWMNSTDITKSGTPISYASTAHNNDFLIFDYRNFQIYRIGATPQTGVSANDGIWHHIAVTWRGSDGQVRLYKDGSQAYSVILAPGTSITGGGSLVFAQEQDNIGNAFQTSQAFLGLIDEVRISNIIRSPEWIETSFNNQNNPSSFLTFDAQQIFVPAPTMTEWGMIIFMLLAVLGAVYYLRKYKDV